jgi:hypothetical protein
MKGLLLGRNRNYGVVAAGLKTKNLVEDPLLPLARRAPDHLGFSVSWEEEREEGGCNQF